MSRSRSLAIKCLLACQISGLAFGAGACSANINGTTPEANRIFVTNSGNDTVSAFPVGKFGNITPVITYSNSDAVVGCSPDGETVEKPSSITLDRRGNLYIANDGSLFRGYDSVTVFDERKPPLASPKAAICTSGNKDWTGFGSPRAIAVDGKGYMYVATFFVAGLKFGPTITVYTSGSNGNVAPVRTITGAATGLFQPAGLATDSSGVLYALNTNGGPLAPGGSITIYSLGANGNAAPVKMISGTAASDQTGLDSPSALALDKANNIYVANDGSSDGPGGADSVTIYRAGSSGNVKPIARISGGLTQLDDPSAVAVDAIGNIYVANNGNGNHPDSITVYPPGSNGNVAPAMQLSNGKLIRNAIIKGSLTNLDSPSGIALSPAL